MPNLKEIRTKILHSDCYATTALLIAYETLGPDFLYWTPHTIRQELDSKFGDIPLTTYNKLFAAQTIITTDYYYRLIDHFHVINNCLFHGTIDDAITNSLEFGWGLVEAQLLMPHPIPEDPKQLFSSTILDYLDVLWKYEGLLKSPNCYSIGGIVFNYIDTALDAFSDNPQIYEGLYRAAIQKAEAIDMIVREKIRELMYELRKAGYPVTPEFIVRSLSAASPNQPVVIPYWLV